MSDRFTKILKTATLCLCALSFAWVSEADATRYVYRIGGGDLPEPEFPEGWDVQFVPLEWSDVQEDLFGQSTLVDMSAGTLRPVGLDESVNLTPQIRDNGGWIKSPDGYSFKDEGTLDLLFDGDETTAYSGGGSSFTGHGTCFGIPPEDTSGGRSARICAQDDRIFERFGRSKGIYFNLGGRLPIRKIVFYPTPRYASERIVKNFLIGTNDGNDLLKGTREAAFWIGRYGLFVDFEVQHLFFDNNEPRIELDMGDMAIRDIVFESTVGVWELAEFEIYGAGFAPEASYTSNIIPLDPDQPVALGDLRWSGKRPENTDVVISMRSGDVPDPHFYWKLTFRGEERTRFDGGKVLTRSDYDKLEGGAKGGITPNTESWEFWSPPVTFDDESAALAARRPRQYIQFQADLFSDNPIETHSTLDYLEFDVSRPPLVSIAKAEITPIQVNPREITRFSYLILPEFTGSEGGFNSIEIETPVRVASVDSLVLPSATSRSRDTLDVRSIAEISENGFVIQFPDGFRTDQNSAGEPIEVIFRAPVYTYGSVFPGRVFDSEKPWEVRQRVTPGDVNPSIDSSSLTVGLSEVGAKSVGDLMLSSPVLTPNGDDVNDVLTIEYELVNLAGSVPITVGIYDLSGRLVAELANSRASGRHSELWYGTYGNELGGKLAAPGLYIIRMEVATDEVTDTVLSTVALAY